MMMMLQQRKIPHPIGGTIFQGAKSVWLGLASWSISTKNTGQFEEQGVINLAVCDAHGVRSI